MALEVGEDEQAERAFALLDAEAIQWKSLAPSAPTVIASGSAPTMKKTARNPARAAPMRDQKVSRLRELTSNSRWTMGICLNSTIQSPNSKT